MKTGFKIKLMLLPLVVLAALTSCVKDYGSANGGGDGETTVTFSLAVPGPSRISTRSLTVSDEGNVSQIDLLLFEGGTFRLMKAAATLNNSNPTKKTFEVTLPQGTYDIVIIANGRQSIINAGLQRGVTPKVDALQALRHSLAVGTKWTSNTIQMWGYKDAVVIDQNTDLTDKSGSGGQDNSIKMSRMVSKVEVELSATAAGGGNSNFAITSVHLYNYNDRGHLIPDMTAGWDAAQGKATAPNIPAGTVKTKGPLVYTAADDVTGTFFTPSQVKNTIYTFEAEAGSTAGKLTNTCVVIGGSYLNSGADTHFYRMDFVKADKSYLSLLRNHRYMFKINSITGEGFTTPEEAFTAGPVNIEADVVEWNDGTVGDAVFDGQYYLVIRPSSELEFERSAETQTAQIKTDYPAGWEVTKITEVDGTTVNSGWLTTDKAIGALQPSGSFVAMDITTTLNDTGLDRVGYIYVKAGRMNMRIMVTQIAEDRLRLVITDVMGRDVNTLTFDAANPIEQLLRVTFEPKSADLNIEVTQMGMDPFNYDNGDALITDIYPGFNGLKSYKINPRIYNLAINPFVENISKVEFMVTDGVNYATKTIYLQQMNYETVASAKPLYPLDGGNYAVVVKSSSSWVVANVTGDTDILGTTTVADIMAWTGGKSATGESLVFNLKSDLDNALGLDGKFITVTLEDPTGKAAPISFNIRGGNCGNYDFAIPLEIGINGYDNKAAISSADDNKKTYMTYRYAGKCWMVQNTREGTPWSTTHSGYHAGERGYYYDTNVIPVNPCPAGWLYPNYTQFMSVAGEINPLPNGTGGKNYWNSADMLAGFYQGYYGRWMSWGITGTFNFAGAARPRILFIVSADGNLSYHDTPAAGDENSYGVSIRCIRDL